MAGVQLWGVWVQPITNDTTAANVEKYGEIEDMAQAYRDGFAKDFCDGQTSPTPPRWPDDRMQLIYTYDRESAQLISDFLRGTIDERIAEGSLQPAGGGPSWLGNLASMGLTEAARGVLFAETIAAASAAGEGSSGAVLAELTASQLAGRLEAYIAATGDRRPTTEAFYAWLVRRYEETGEP